MTMTDIKENVIILSRAEKFNRELEMDEKNLPNILNREVFTDSGASMTLLTPPVSCNCF
jgi:hypothetical protein